MARKPPARKTKAKKTRQPAAKPPSDAAAPRAGQLPAQVVGPTEVIQLLRELEAIDSSLLSHTLRKERTGAHNLKTSELMEQLVHINHLNLLQKSDRERLKRFLETVKQRAPTLHMSFSAEPSANFLERLMAWLRREIHPQLLLTVGVQPTIAAGCIVRSTNKYFDFSIRRNFTDKGDLLIQQLSGRPSGKEQP